LVGIGIYFLIKKGKMKKIKNQRLESLPYEINLRFSEAIS